MTARPPMSRRRERLKRRLRRLTIALATVLMAIATLLYFFPLQSVWLQSRVERELSAALNRPVSIGAMFVYVFQNEVVIHDVTLGSSVIPGDDGSPSPPYRIRKIVLHAALLSMPWRGMDSISLVEVHEPGALEATFDDDHNFISEGVPGEMLEAMLMRRRSASMVREPAAAPNTRLPVTVAVYNARLTLHVKPSPISTFTVRLTEGVLSGNRQGDLSTYMRGYVDYGNTLTPYQTDLSYRAATEAVEGRIKLPGQAVFAPIETPGLYLPPIQVSDLALSLRREGAQGQRLFHIELSADESRLMWPGRPRPIEDSRVTLQALFHPPGADGASLVVNPLVWKSRFGEFEGRLAIQPEAPTTFTLTMDHARLGPAALREGLAVAERQYGVRFDDRLTSASVSFSAAGSLAGGIKTLRGGWALSHLTLAHPSLPTPVLVRHVDGAFDQRGISVNNLDITAFHTDFKASGRLDAPAFQPRRLRVEWDTETGLQDAGSALMALAPQTLPMTFGGKVRTRGWLQLEFPLSEHGLESANFDIALMPENAIYEVPSRGLRGSIIGGELHMSPSLLEFRDLRVRQFDSLFQVRGTIAGERLFWEHPRASLGFEGVIPLHDFVVQIAPRREGLPPMVSAFGRMGLKAQLSGPLDSPDELYWQAEGEVHQATVNFPALPALAGIGGLEGQWIFNGDVIQLQSLSGQWGPIPFAVQGRVAPRLIALNATSELNLEDFVRQIPSLNEEYVMSGPVTAQATITCAIPADPFTTATLTAGDAGTSRLMAAIAAEARAHTQRIGAEVQSAIQYILLTINDEARRSLPILQSDKIDLAGSLKVRDGAFGHVSMPALISRINADMEWSDHRLSWTGATGMAGRSAIVSGPCSIDLGGAHPAMTFTGSMEDFDLNQWIADWPRSQPTTATLRQDHRTTKTLFSIDLDATARRASIYRYVLEDFSGTMHYEKWRNAPSWLVFDTQSANAFGGAGQAKGRVRFEKGEKPYFDFTVGVEKAALDQYFKQISPRHANMRGLVSGECAVWGRPKDSKNLRGEGRFVIEDSELMRFPMFDGLANLTGMGFFRQASFSRIEGEFELRDGRVNFKRVVCDNPFVKVQAVGWVDYETNLSLDVTLSYFRAIGDSVPIISGVMRQVDALIGMTMGVKVTGTLEEPIVELEIL